MDKIKEFVLQLNQINWGAFGKLSTETRGMVDAFLAAMKSNISRVSVEKSVSAVEACMLLETAGWKASGYQKALEWVADNLDTSNAGAREPLILTVTAAFFWNLDEEFGEWDNPWQILLELYLKGCPAYLDWEQETEGVNLILPCKEILTFRIL